MPKGINIYILKHTNAVIRHDDMINFKRIESQEISYC